MRVRALLRNLFLRRAADGDLREEIDSYAAEMNARHPRSVYAEPLRDEVRAARPGAGIESWARDFRYAGRMLRKSPALTLACVLTFAAGVGATTVVFSMVNALALRQLPVPHPGQLQMLSMTVHGHTGMPVLTAADLHDLAAQPQSAFSAVTSLSINSIGVGVRGQARVALGGFVSGNYFAVMGVQPALGRFFSQDDASAVVLSYDYWRARFGANADVLGAAATVEGRPATIVGVAPRGYHGIANLFDVQVYVPVGLAPKGNAGGVPVMGIPIVRLRPRAARTAAEAELALLARRLGKEHPRQDTALAFHLWPMGNGVVSNQGGANPFAMVTGLFLALAMLVLLLAAANIMGVLLARARTREREMAVRSALGAGRRRLARQVFLEALLLAAVGGAAGILLGIAASRILAALPPQSSFPIVLDFSFDGRVYAFGFAMALLMALVAGLLPAWRAASADPNQSLRGPEPGIGGARRQRLRATLVAAQVAGSLALLIVGGLFLRSLLHQQHRPLGFQPARVWNFELDTSGANYTPAQGKAFFDRLLPAVSALPGVRGAALAAQYPFGTLSDVGPVHARQTPQSTRDTGINAVSPGYFALLGIPLLEGRGVAATDTAASPAVAVVSARLAQSLWPGQNAIGRQIVLGSGGAPTTVVGVAGNLVHSFGNPDEPQVYFPLSQDYHARQVLQVRAGGAASPVPAVERLLRQLGPEVPLGTVQSMSAAVNGLNGMFLFRLGARLATALGLLGLFLAVIGVYGVVAYAAAQRTHEIGVRVALGARPRQLLAGILRRAALMVGTGMAFGLLAAAAFGKIAGALLAGVSGLDPLTFIAASLLLALVALAAALIPALRASRADPLAALRCE